MIGVALRNRLRRIARHVDPGYRLRGLPRQLRGALFARSRPVATPEDGNHLIAGVIRDGRPAAIGKIGNSELRLALRWMSGSPVRFPNWLREEALVGPGVFPADDRTLGRFCEFWLERLGTLDLLGVWYNAGEARVVREAAPEARCIGLEALEPYRFAEPWSHALAGRRVVLVTPFARTAAVQYERRHLLWSGKPTPLPDFDLRIVAAPFSPALVPPSHPDWFARCEDLASQLERSPFDVALIGAGALSIPLCAHAKRLGSIGIHTGGSTQVLFGIHGRRFDDDALIAGLANPHWRRPLPEETPKAAGLVENAAYW
ncbi:hypothetical protein [Azospirillum sp. TSH100]|uniref:hypothetical protein n=1 Tax=Azospirillum sp. TSH100 TaxID=652764 RepID=UPI000D65DA15|nr:hypothetical protein [Azospirillum sp. TSH100]QCG92158.1 hypothetical protein E6C72_30685 [Azospirillum sp. TSH100]